MARPVFRHIAIILPLLVVLTWTIPVTGQHGAENGEWRFYSGDGGSTRYSPLDQINRDNVKNLRIAWRWKSDNFGTPPEFKNETTPIMGQRSPLLHCRIPTRSGGCRCCHG